MSEKGERGSGKSSCKAPNDNLFWRHLQSIKGNLRILSIPCAEFIGTFHNPSLQRAPVDSNFLFLQMLHSFCSDSKMGIKVQLSASLVFYSHQTQSFYISTIVD